MVTVVTATAIGAAHLDVPAVLPRPRLGQCFARREAQRRRGARVAGGPGGKDAARGRIGTRTLAPPGTSHVALADGERSRADLRLLARAAASVRAEVEGTH